MNLSRNIGTALYLSLILALAAGVSGCGDDRNSGYNKPAVDSRIVCLSGVTYQKVLHRLIPQFNADGTSMPCNK